MWVIGMWISFQRKLLFLTLPSLLRSFLSLRQGCASILLLRWPLQISMIPCFPRKATNRYTLSHLLSAAAGTHKHPLKLPAWPITWSILSSWSLYFGEKGIQTEVWNEKFSSLFLKPRGICHASVMTTLGPKRRPRNKPQMSGEQHNWYPSTAVSALQGNLPWTLLEHTQQNMARVTQEPPTTGTLSAKDTIVIISWKQFCYCPVAYWCECLLRVTSYLHWSRVQAGLSKTERRCCKPPVPWLLFKACLLCCMLLSALCPQHSCFHHYR